MVYLATDLSAFSLGLDTPSKFLNGAPTGLTPAPWSMGTGLTPSLLGGFSGSGWTPSLTAVAGSKGELNPFEISLSNSSKRRAAAAGVDFPLDRDDAAARGSGTSGLGDNMFDFLATTPGSAGGGRKRALSSPAVEMGAGSASFPFLAQPPPSHHGTAIANDGVQRLKRPRMAPVQASSLTSQDPLFSTFERGESDESPASSVVLTPPDTAPLYKPDGKSSEKVPPSAEKVDIAVSASPTAPHLPAHVPPAAAPPLHVTQPFSALSRLAQERSALIAGGRGILSQNQPLPMKQPGSSFALPQAVPASAPIAPESAAADISVKAEPGEEQQDLAASTSRAESHAPRPPVTRGQSKRGTRSSLALGSASSSTGVSPAPAATPSGPKRKASRKKSTAASTRREKTKEPSLAPLEGEEDDEEGEGSGKRQQFLERNRVAACKSRQKKKEKVAGLEQCESVRAIVSLGCSGADCDLRPLQSPPICARGTTCCSRRHCPSARKRSPCGSSCMPTSDAPANTVRRPAASLTCELARLLTPFRLSRSPRLHRARRSWRRNRYDRPARGANAQPRLLGPARDGHRRRRLLVPGPG